MELIVIHIIPLIISFVIATFVILSLISAILFWIFFNDPNLSHWETILIAVGGLIILPPFIFAGIVNGVTHLYVKLLDILGIRVPYPAWISKVAEKVALAYPILLFTGLIFELLITLRRIN